MRLLLDTHTFLWLVNGDPSLSAAAWSLLDDPADNLHLSIASPWELAIKVSTGKLTLARPVREYVETYLAPTRVTLMPVTMPHIAVVATLPRHHGDPFDRFIISQAIVEGLVVVSLDPAFDAYPIVRRW